MSTLLLDIDRSASVFSLLFAFVQDEVCVDDEIYGFEEVLYEILQGVKLPPDALSKLRRLYEKVDDEPLDLLLMARQITVEFKDDRQVLVALLSILMRLAVDEGIICKRSRRKIAEMFTVFDFDNEELKELTDDELAVLRLMLSGSDSARVEECSPELRGHYSVLGCQPDATDKEVRRAYRMLVKLYHPDKAAGQRISEESSKRNRRQFQQVQLAFEAIQRARALGF